MRRGVRPGSVTTGHHPQMSEWWKGMTDRLITLVVQPAVVGGRIWETMSGQLKNGLINIGRRTVPHYPSSVIRRYSRVECSQLCSYPNSG